MDIGKLDLLKSNEDLHLHISELADLSSRHITLATMLVDDLGDMPELIDSWRVASERGVHVRLIYDRYFSAISLLKKGGIGGVIRFSKRLKELRISGVEIVDAGRMTVNIFAGRQHAKLYAFDDTVLLAGGVNLCWESFLHRDFMMATKSYNLSEFAHRDLSDILQANQNRHIQLDSKSSLLIDGGVKGKSLILKTTIDMLDGASKVWYVSQMLPAPELTKALTGVDKVKVWHNSPKIGGISMRLAAKLDSRKFSLTNQYTQSDYIHAKFCVAEYSDGSRRAITGSHNFNQRGVDFGTKEVALDTTNPATCRQLIDFAENLNS